MFDVIAELDLSMTDSVTRPSCSFHSLLLTSFTQDHIGQTTSNEPRRAFTEPPIGEDTSCGGSSSNRGRGCWGC